MLDKSLLTVGEHLQHDLLGDTTYTERCAFLESEYGDPTTLFVEVKGTVQCLTLALMSK
jgi:hypothetical protein